MKEPRLWRWRLRGEVRKADYFLGAIEVFRVSVRAPQLPADCGPHCLSLILHSSHKGAARGEETWRGVAGSQGTFKLEPFSEYSSPLGEA